MKRIGGMAAATVAVGLALVFFSPFLFRHVAFFRIRQIEVVGLDYLDQREVLEALQLTPQRTVFHGPSDIVERALRTPGIIGVEVDRRLPGTLVLTFRERVPVAFAMADDHLVPLDANGDLLPYDPVGSRLDLPVMAEVDSVLIRALAVVRSTDVALFDATDAASIRGDETVVLEVGGQRILLAGVPTTGELAAIAAVRRYLGEQGTRAVEIDGRYQGNGENRVIVRAESS